VLEGVNFTNWGEGEKKVTKKVRGGKIYPRELFPLGMDRRMTLKSRNREKVFRKRRALIFAKNLPKGIGLKPPLQKGRAGFQQRPADQRGDKKRLLPCYKGSRPGEDTVVLVCPQERTLREMQLHLVWGPCSTGR